MKPPRRLRPVPTTYADRRDNRYRSVPPPDVGMGWVPVGAGRGELLWKSDPTSDGLAVAAHP